MFTILHFLSFKAVKMRLKSSRKAKRRTWQIPLYSEAKTEEGLRRRSTVLVKRVKMTSGRNEAFIFQSRYK